MGVLSAAMKHSAIDVPEISILETRMPTLDLPVGPATFLVILTPHELRQLDESLQRRIVPLDFESKLNRFARGNLVQRSISKHSFDFIALLLAAYHGGFQEAKTADCERLLRVLAYVRKDDDVIPDYRPDGLLDDQQEVRAVTTQLGPLLRSFKAWHLCHQVPALWGN
jgi:hypothetical protein